VVPWPRTKYGRLHRGDSFIILRTSASPYNPDKLEWDIHFWIGSESSQDEYGTAAYKAVELDDALRGGATQHREVRREIESVLGFKARCGPLEWNEA
jgi:gelsolin